jgi:hypothetical protein
LKQNRQLPDPELSLRDASDFILDSPLGRRALSNPEPRNLAVFLRDIVQTIYRLTISCHLPEFTDHGLGHLCSLVDRLSHWTKPESSANPSRVIEDRDFEPREAAILLLAALLHDIGMLSQRPEDMPTAPGTQSARSLRDLPGWVRSTHIERMENLARYLFEGADLDHPVVQRAFLVARAHGKWPWEWAKFNFIERDAGLAAMLAVADLLDEDSMRCDSFTLLRHRYGTPLNCAHWIRHGLTAGRVIVDAGRIRVVLARPPCTDAQLEPLFTALRNHYQLVWLYMRELGQVNASLIGIEFDPQCGIPERESPELEGWLQIPGFGVQSALVHHLFNSFMPEALLDETRVSPDTINRLRTLRLAPIDLTDFHRFRGRITRRTPVEENFHVLLGLP